jgi:hypothetical protein
MGAFSCIICWIDSPLRNKRYDFKVRKAGATESSAMWTRVPSPVLALFLVGAFLIGNVAADNIRELPIPAELPQPGSIMLHGGERVTIEAFDCFVNLAGGPEAKIVLIPSVCSLTPSSSSISTAVVDVLNGSQGCFATMNGSMP